MKSQPEAPKAPRTWKEIDQAKASRQLTPISRKRKTYAMLRTIGIIALLGAVAWGAVEFYIAWKRNPAHVKAPVKSEPLKTITVRNPNGVLDREWVERTLALPKGIGMMELDLAALRERLLSHPQVQTALLTREFPDTLIIAMEERAPVARLVVQQSENELQEYLVARDGAVFIGANYKPEILASLPYLADVNLIRTTPGSSHFEPLQGIDMVYDLVNQARSNIPETYSTWRSISLKRYVDDRVLIVNTSARVQIIFGTRDGFYTQIAELDYIMDHFRNTPPDFTRGNVRIIDLSVGKTTSGVQVPVTFDAPPQPVVPTTRGTVRH